LDVYRDCTLGTAEFDSAFYFSIRRHSDNGLVHPPLGIKLTLIYRDTLENETYSTCHFAQPALCVELGHYQTSTFIPPSPGGHYIVFEKCCRNQNIVNIAPSGNQSSTVGALWYLEVPDNNNIPNNSSPVFKNYPPKILCKNALFTFDHSAMDFEGDQLVYSICQPFNGASTSNATPVPSPTLFGGFQNINYMPTYSFGQPLGNLSNLSINATTGILTGTPTTTGKFVVAICASEFRNGVLLSTNKRDFQFNVTTCDTVSTAKFSYQINCNGSIRFIDESLNTETWDWDFGDPSTSTDISTLQNPNYLYTSAGNYTVVLILNKGLSCADTFNLLINVLPPLAANFSSNKVCSGLPTQFSDLSITNSFAGSINSWNWNFGDGSIHSTQQNPSHLYATAGSYTAILIIGTALGCLDTISQIVNVFPTPTVFAGLDTIIGFTHSVQLNPVSSSAANFTWSPSLNLSNALIANPLATPSVTTTYTVVVKSIDSCMASDDIIITITLPIEIEVPNAFSPNDDDLNDLFLVYNKAGKNDLVIDHIIFRVFDRWGKLLFETNNINQGWDGTDMNNTLPLGIGLYAWTLEVFPKNGSTIPKMSGNVSLIR
jgi:gliding motility-associated-like protein